MISACDKASVYKPFWLCFIMLLTPITRSSVEMMGLIGAGNNPMVGMTVACAVAIEEASK